MAQASLVPVSWNSDVSGDWGSAALWSTGAVPGPDSTVGIAVAGTYTVTVASAASAGAVTIDDGGATLSIAADLTLGGTLAVTAGTLTLARSGTITGGTLLADAGGTLILDNGGTLNDVAVQGTLRLAQAGGALTLGQGLAAGSTATIEVTGANETLNFADTATLNSTTITLDPARFQSFINLADTSATAQTFTIGTNSAIAAIAGTAFLDGDTFSENLANLTIANDGTLAATGSSTSLGIGSEAGAFDNAGLISVSSGATLLLEPTTIVNTGTITVSGAGSTLYYDYGVEINGAPSWSNTGDIALSAGGTVLLYGTGGLSGLLGISNHGGVVNICGTLTGPGTLPLPAYSPGSLLLSGTLSGATIFDPNGTSAFYQGGADLTNDSYRGTLNIDNIGVSIQDVTFSGANGKGSGTILLQGGNSNLNIFDGTLNNAVLSIGGGNLNFAFANTSPVTLTLGPHFEILDAGGAYINDDGIGCTIDNEGTILAGDSGGQLTINDYGTPGSATDILINSGTIEATNGDKLDYSADNSANSLTNTGLISASGGATLSLVQSTVTTTGTVTATGRATSMTFGTQPTNLGTVAASWTNGGTIGVSNGATMALMGGVNNSGKITESGGTLMFISDVVNSGTISAAGGSLTFGKVLAGSGVLDIGSDASVVLPGSAQGHLDFVAGGGVLQTSHADLLYGLIGGFAALDSIDLLKTKANGLSYASGTLTVTEGSTVVAHLHFAGSYTSASFTLVSDGHGGSVLHYV